MSADQRRWEGWCGPGWDESKRKEAVDDIYYFKFEVEWKHGEMPKRWSSSETAEHFYSVCEEEKMA